MSNEVMYGLHSADIQPSALALALPTSDMVRARNARDQTVKTKAAKVLLGEFVQHLPSKCMANATLYSYPPRSKNAAAAYIQAHCKIGLKTREKFAIFLNI